MVFGINFNRLNAFEASESSCYRIYLKKLNKIQKTHVKPEIKKHSNRGRDQITNSTRQGQKW